LFVFCLCHFILDKLLVKGERGFIQHITKLSAGAGGGEGIYIIQTSRRSTLPLFSSI
jgi:hypothetical protein